MTKVEEAQQVLKDSTQAAIGMIALGYATFDLDKVIRDYSELFDNQLNGGFLQPKAAVNAYDNLEHGFVLWQLYQENDGDERLVEFLSNIYPTLLELQQYYYQTYCPSDDGLIVEKQNIDPQVNSLFAWSNESIIELGYALELSSFDLFEKNEMTLHSMNELLWDESSGLYHCYDVVAQKCIDNQSISGFLPMIAGAPDINQILTMVHRIFGDDFRQEGYYSFPSSSLKELDANNATIIISTNWLLIQGLCRYDMDDLADVAIEDTLLLLERFGFYENFDTSKSSEQTEPDKSTSPLAAAIFLHLSQDDF